MKAARLVKEVIDLKKKGRSNRAIAKELSVSHWTVKKYWTLRKLILLLMEMLENGRIGIDMALRLARLPLFGTN
jgi:orotate phosphoribosyltransferase-like protein